MFSPIQSSLQDARNLVEMIQVRLSLLREPEGLSYLGTGGLNELEEAIADLTSAATKLTKLERKARA